MNKKQFVAAHRGLVSLLCKAHNLGSLLRIRKKGKENRVEIPCALLKKTSIRIYGNDNVVTVGDFSQLNGVSIQIHGDHHRINLGAWGTYNGTEIYLEQDGCSVTVGDHAHFYGKVELAAMEKTNLTIGEDCLCSSNIRLRTGDSHSVLDLTGCRINPSKDITLGDHVWIGADVTILKGSRVAPHCIIGTGALVTGSFPEPNCSLGGVPAKVLKKDVDWSVHHIAVGEKAPDFLPPEVWQKDNRETEL